MYIIIYMNIYKYTDQAFVSMMQHTVATFYFYKLLISFLFFPFVSMYGNSQVK